MKKQLFTTFVIAGLALSSTQAIIARVPRPSQIKDLAATQQQAQNVEFVSQIGDTANDVAISGTLAYVGAGSRLVTLNISNPAYPSIVGQTDPLPDAVRSVTVRDYAYIAAGGAGLRVVDVSAPASPIEVGFCHAPGEYAQDVVVMGSHAYVSDYNRDMGGGLAIIDISDPTQPSEVGFYHTQYANGVDTAVAGNYAYVLTHGNLHVVDISNPANPAQVSWWSFTPRWAWAIAVQGSYAYIAARDAGLLVVDVSNPMSPVEVGVCDTPGYAYGVAVAGNYAYVADGNAGLRVVDISSPMSPVEVGFYETSAEVRDVAVEGNYVYVPIVNRGLTILWFAPPVVSSIPVVGGSLVSSADNITYTFSAGTFTDTVVLTHTARFARQTSFGNLIGIGHLFDVTAVYSSTGQPAQPVQPYTITIQYTDAEKGPAIESTLGLYWWDSDDWSQEGITSTVNTVNNVVTAQADHLSLFAVLGETRRVYLPLVLRNY